jgi:hypothetical protein
MRTIKKDLIVSGSKSGRNCEVLFDTGASTCFAREDVASELGEILKSPFSVAFKLVNNTVVEAKSTTDLFVKIKGYNLNFLFLVIPELPYEIIIGADFLQKWKIRLDPVDEDFTLDEKALEIILV